jgi:hypothetical protein
MVPCDDGAAKLNWKMEFTLLSKHHKPVNPLSHDKAPDHLIA